MELSKIFPIQSVDDDFMVAGNGDVTFGFKVFLKDVFTLDSKQYDDLNESYRNFLRLLPVGAIFHQQDYYYKDNYISNVNEKDNFTMYHNKVHWHLKPVLCAQNYIFITVPLGSKKMNFRFNNIDFVLKRPFKGVENRINELINLKSNIKNNLNSFLNVIPLKKEDYLSVLSSYWNGSYFQGENNVLNPVYEDKSYLKIGDKITNVFSLIEENGLLENSKIPKVPPASAFGTDVEFNNSINAVASMTYPIGIGLPINHIVNTVIEITDNDQITLKLNNEKRNLNILSSFNVPAAVSKQKAIEGVYR